MDAPSTLDTANQVAQLSNNLIGLFGGLCAAIFAIAGLFFGHRQNSKDIDKETKAREKVEGQMQTKIKDLETNHDDDVKKLEIANKELRADFIGTLNTLQLSMNSILSGMGEIKGQMNAQTKRGD